MKLTRDLPTPQEEDPDWSYKQDLAARAAAGGLKTPADAAGGAPAEPDEELQAEAASRIKAGDRCEAAGGRRGQVMYVGKVGGATLRLPDSLAHGCRSSRANALSRSS